MENKEKLSYEQPLLEEAHFGTFVAGNSMADDLNPPIDPPH